MFTKKEQIRFKAIEILKNNPIGVRYSELVNSIKQNFPNMSINTINTSVWNIDAIMPNEIYKPDRGLFRHISFKETQAPEKDFYRKPIISESKITSKNTDDFFILQTFKEEFKNIKFFLDGNNSGINSERLCFWVYLCYTFKYYREGVLIFRRIEKENIRQDFYSIAKKISEACEIKAM